MFEEECLNTKMVDYTKYAKREFQNETKNHYSNEIVCSSSQPAGGGRIPFSLSPFKLKRDKDII
ncbi:hypothetical protein [Fructobacillus tropaeoli]|uniref:hypothetical protein n=1 Tax=Fructobacillus tropaeoli TaxID=709323 RepID=UPI0019439A7E|nr:hypothetical protein [Fructobacillus tropaeoli]GIC69383.1 hypothetical protein FT12353_00190 [Fructobacillus tropaeoli]